MKPIIALSLVAALAMTPSAQAGGFFGNAGNGGLLGNITSAVGLRDVNVLNGNTVAVGNNSSILSNIGNGILSGNGILGVGGHNTSYANSGNTTHTNTYLNSGNTTNSGNKTSVNSGNSQSSYWNSFNRQSSGKRW
ncbi:hypothetical protein ACFOOL_00880 [Devosia honganensis]|uniref:Uncharacterized protein n=1 Tax=Devosia honganensis TaxID=1610527 RepID=A0ABV7WWN4_9HYPH